METETRRRRWMHVLMLLGIALVLLAASARWGSLNLYSTLAELEPNETFELLGKEISSESIVIPDTCQVSTLSGFDGVLDVAMSCLNGEDYQVLIEVETNTVTILKRILSIPWPILW